MYKFIIYIILLFFLFPLQLYATESKGAEGKEKKAVKKKKALTYEALQVPVIPPKGLKYGLQTGLYMKKKDLQIQKKLLTTNGYKVKVLEVQDTSKANWFVLAAGPYKTVAAAKADQYNLRFLHSVTSDLISIPEDKPKK